MCACGYKLVRAALHCVQEHVAWHQGLLPMVAIGNTFWGLQMLGSHWQEILGFVVAQPPVMGNPLAKSSGTCSPLAAIARKFWDYSPLVAFSAKFWDFSPLTAMVR